jgi:hypothetical protein
LDVAGSNINFTSAAKYNIDLLLEFFKVLYLDLDIISVTGRVRVLFVLCATVQPDRQRKEQLFRTGVFRQLSTAGSDLTGRYNDRT